MKEESLKTPSLHSRFSSSEVTTYITVIYFMRSESLRLIAIVLSLITCRLSFIVIAWSKVHLKVHYPRDVIGGFIIRVPTRFTTSYT